MIVRDQKQALCVAVEMERRAIRVYERALMLASAPQVRAGIQAILQDERDHLRRFAAMRDRCPMESSEERMLIQAVAAEMLFPGGVMEIERAQGLNDLRSLYAFAAQSEREAVAHYAAFAEKCQGDVASAFRAIAKEESGHLAELLRKQDQA